MNDILRLQIDVSDDTVQRGMERMAAGIRSDSILRGIGEEVKKATQARILQSGPDPDGHKWVALAARTQKAKKGKGMLRESGALMDSITWQIQGAAEVAIGSRMVYARIHQLGGMAGPSRKVKIPARPYLGLNEEEKAKLQRRIVAWLKRLAEA